VKRDALISFRAEADLIAALEAAADADGKSRSAAIRAALAEHLEAREPAA
jgi:predicted transcriptional regulator